MNIKEEEEKEKEIEWFIKLPKVELHAHLNGSIRDTTILELINESYNSFSFDLYNNQYSIIENFKININKERTLTESFQLFDLIYTLTTNKETIARITYEVIEDFAKENVKYLELRTTPREVKNKMTKKDFVETVISVMKKCEKEFDIIVRLLLSINRAYNIESAWETVNLAIEYKCKNSFECGVIGIDLSGNPSVGDINSFIPILQYAQQNDLFLSLHIGEIPNKEEEIEKLISLKPERIGHGIFLSDKIIEYLYKNPIPLEVCLTSNVKTRSVTTYENHHFKDYYQKKYPIIICTDDKGIFSTNLSNEYAIACKAFNMTKFDIYQLSFDSINFIFAPNEIKEIIKLKFEKKKKEIFL